ncbi:hypothetical protein BDN71DRAFT_1430992 [Pleurotus eryngii]|uniref:Uncharacterized protein n=1 Tax=Pleurotus eryngii TaxID=5323 RepID=A0A9P5ZXQ7_PLEER|nr:hypothetical protein BDN71DRAFT_1430992 [Pleurotus eryngii]
MRRFASVFLPKRDKNESKKSAAAPRKAEEAASLAIHTAVSPAHSLPPPLNLTSHSSDRAQSSSSSTASASIQTPDDESPLSRSPTKKSWKSWLGTVKSRKLKRGHPNHSRTSLHAREPKYDADAHPLPFLHLPPQGNRRLLDPSTFRLETTAPPSTDGSDDANILLANDADSNHPDPFIARANVRKLTQRRLQDATCLPPFANVAGSPLFPKSCNALGLPKQRALLATMFRQRLLRRLDGDGIPMDDPDIMHFASLNLGQYVPPRASLMSSSIDISSVPTDFHVSGFSTGVRRWISRPCFEERYLVWLPEDGVIVRKGISGTSFAVLDLEFSEAMEVTAGFDAGSPTPVDAAPTYETIAEKAPTIPIFHLPEQPSTTHESGASPDAPVGVPTAQDGASTVANDTSSSPSPSHSEGEGEEPIVLQSPLPSIPAPTVKRGVRFADDVPDRLPVGYAQGMKKRREEKAKFLREEQAQRALVMERRKIEEQRRLLEYEKRQREKDRLDFEREKQTWEREKRERESADREKQERREKALRDEVTAARLRREAQRAGNVPSGLRESTYAGLDDGPGRSKLHPSFSSSTSLRQDSRERNTAAGEVYDPTSRARPPSISASTRPPTTNINSALSPATAYGPPHARSSPSNSGSSPGSSRPPSLSGGAYSNHAPEDAGSKMKRHSVASTSSGPFVDRSSTTPNYPTFHGGPLPAMWNGSQQSLNGMVIMTPVNPMMPAQVNTMMFPGVGLVPSMMDMPLLPPTPPFMMQQYRRSSNSSSSSRDHSLDRQSSRQRESSQGSGRSSGSERLHQRPTSSAPSSPHNRSSHSRRGSTDMSPSAFPASKHSSPGISLNNSSYRHGPSSSSSSLAQGSTTNPHRYSQTPPSTYERPYSERGRSLHPGQSTRSPCNTSQQMPSPWTALPTRHGGLPSQMLPNPGQRQPNS